MLSDGTWTYTWEHGRELATMSNGSTTWTNTYNADGLRTKRTNGSTTYSYVYNGSSLSQMTVGSNTLYFAYDASGTPMSVTYNDTNYYYATNLQGDVTAILNTSGTAVVQYTYDAWGKILTTTGSMASTLGVHNPLRYRGYVYDQETTLYYLQSRYYDPAIGRFINADALVSTGQGVLGNNMFAYCRNNPVCRIDVSGAEDEDCLDENKELDPFEEPIGGILGTGEPTVGTCTGSSNSSYDSYDPYQAQLDGEFPSYDYTPLPRQGTVIGNPNSPPVDAGKQGKHVPGHNNYQEGKSSWPSGRTGVSQTQEAWKNGTQDPTRPGQNIRIGIASDGTIVRVHMDGAGNIHGYPLGNTFFSATFDVF